MYILFKYRLLHATMPCWRSSVDQTSNLARCFKYIIMCFTLMVVMVFLVIVTLYTTFSNGTYELIQTCVHQKDEVPRIIHQMWATDNVPLKWQKHQQGCIRMNSGYKYKLWTDDSIHTFIKENYPWILDTFENYPYPIMKVDAARYFILYHFGGVYFDMDMECKTPFNTLLNVSNGADVILGATLPMGITNSFLISKKNHQFMKFLMEGLPYSNKWYVLPYWTIIMGTGPFYVWRIYRTYECKEQIYVMPNKILNLRYLEHKHLGSWHKWDGPIMIAFDNYGKAMGITAIIVIFAIVVYKFVRKYYRHETLQEKGTCNGKQRGPGSTPLLGQP